jgi:hypothetical protein
MSYSFKISDDKQYILVKVVGEINRKIAFEMNVASHKFGREKGIKKYFIDLTESLNNESPFSSYDFANKDMKQSDQLDINAIVALYVDKDDHSHDFFETAAVNAGLSVKLFRNKQDAINYLKKTE